MGHRKVEEEGKKPFYIVSYIDKTGRRYRKRCSTEEDAIALIARIKRENRN